MFPRTTTIVMDAVAFNRHAHGLYCELTLLNKILYRNANQHGRSKIFSYLQSLRRLLQQQLNKERLERVQTRCSEMLLSQTAQRSSEPTIAGLLICLKGLELSMNVLTRGLHRAKCAAASLALQLRKRVFTGIFSLLVALVSRMHGNMKALRARLGESFDLLCGRLRAIASALQVQKPDSVLSKRIVHALECAKLLPISSDDSEVMLDCDDRAAEAVETTEDDDEHGGGDDDLGVAIA
jgi:hypothetical protein